MPKLSESALRQLIKNGETSTVELKVASPRPDEMAERLCGLANAKGGLIIRSEQSTQEPGTGAERHGLCKSSF